MKDYWGNDALDFGTHSEMRDKYADKFFVSVSNKPFGKCYIVFICNRDEYDKAKKFLDEYDKKMAERGIKVYGSGIGRGDDLHAERLNAFIGGVGI